MQQTTQTAAMYDPTNGRIKSIVSSPDLGDIVANVDLNQTHAVFCDDGVSGEIHWVAPESETVSERPRVVVVATNTGFEVDKVLDGMTFKVSTRFTDSEIAATDRVVCFEVADQGTVTVCPPWPYMDETIHIAARAGVEGQLIRADLEAVRDHFLAAVEESGCAAIERFLGKAEMTSQEEHRIARELLQKFETGTQTPADEALLDKWRTYSNRSREAELEKIAQKARREETVRAAAGALRRAAIKRLHAAQSVKDVMATIDWAAAQMKAEMAALAV